VQRSALGVRWIVTCGRDEQAFAERKIVIVAEGVCHDVPDGRFS
jgi:hypothetical protein